MEASWVAALDFPFQKPMVKARMMQAAANPAPCASQENLSRNLSLIAGITRTASPLTPALSPLPASTSFWRGRAEASSEGGRGEGERASSRLTREANPSQ